MQPARLRNFIVFVWPHPCAEAPVADSAGIYCCVVVSGVWTPRLQLGLQSAICLVAALFFRKKLDGKHAAAAAAAAIEPGVSRGQRHRRHLRRPSVSPEQAQARPWSFRQRETPRSRVGARRGEKKEAKSWRPIIIIFLTISRILPRFRRALQRLLQCSSSSWETV